jgi:hypothetical protein
MSAGERIHHDTLDVLVALFQEKCSYPGHVRAGFLKDDFVGAYKTLPLRYENLPMAVAVWASAAGSLQVLQFLCCPFGAVSSVYSWHRFGAAIQRILANVFEVAYPRYVDDLFGLDVVPGSCWQGSPE